MSLFTELGRRQVFRAAAWYGGLAWLAVEVSNTVFPAFGLPSWGVRAVIVGALLGFPVVLLLAWSFDLSSAGIRREAEAPAADGPRSPAALWRTPSLWLALALGAGLALSAQQAWRKLVRPPVEARPGLAVLPFTNLSPDAENAYFADGLHEEVLGALAALSGLRVISSTSVQQYRDAKRNLRDIADALDVSLVLEGSVRRSGDDVRVSLQLVDGQRDERVWSETYDRRFRDALDLQRAVASEVAAAIGARLTVAEKHSMEQAGTDVPAAYDRYLQALALLAGPDRDAQMRSALKLLSDAIEVDAGFAQAYALRARLHLELAGSPTAEPGDIEAARADIARSLELEPGLPEGLVARAAYTAYVSLDPARAMDDLARAIEVAPNDAETQAAMGYTLRRLGRYDDAIERFTLAAGLAPASREYGVQVAFTQLGLQRYAEAEQRIETLLRRHPDDMFLRMAHYYVRFAATGETSDWREEAERVAATANAIDRALNWHYALVATGDIRGLAAFYERTPARELQYSRDYVLGVAYIQLGEPAKAEPYLRATAATWRPDMTGANDGYGAAEAAVALALLGDTSSALQAAAAAVRAISQSRDAVNASDVALKRAWVLIRSGDRSEEGYVELARLMHAFGVNARWIAAEPLWRLLHGDARVQKIIEDAFPSA